ncbi:MAG: group II intron reverse transcriptase/maturase [Thiotrichaceae bacterium]
MCDEVSVMGMEQRGQAVQSNGEGQPHSGRSLDSRTKSFQLSKHLVIEAYKRVKANKGSAGVDDQSLADFDQNLKSNLYKLWNRLSSGSYQPPPVLQVEIPKSDGGVRYLGVPTVADRIAQMVVKLQIEPELESHFHPDSFGYRPSRSAHDALRLTQQRCQKRAWVLDMDIKGFFDTIDHVLLMRCVRHHVKEPWQRLYIERWLKVPVQTKDGALTGRTQGTPQGGVISPLLANLFLHYAFDKWVERTFGENILFERYADDIVCHCTTEKQAHWLREQVEARFSGCGLALHPEKAKIAYCKNDYRKEEYETIAFDFLGYTFRPRRIKARAGQCGVYFLADISRKSAKKIRDEISNWPWKYWNQKELLDIRRFSRSRLSGWLNYFGAFSKNGIKYVLFHFDRRLSRWAKNKYKILKSLRQAADKVIQVSKSKPHLFPHWCSI